MPNSSPSSDGGSQQQAFEPAKHPLHHILYGLFFQPQVLLALQQGRMWRPVRILFTLCLLGGVLIGAARFPEARRTTRDWLLWFGEVTRAIRYEDGRLSWRQPRTVPYTTRHQGWKVDFRGDDFAWPGDVRMEPEQRGLVFTPESVLAWHKMEENVQVVPLLKDGRLMDVLSAEAVWPDGLVVQEGEFEGFAAELARGQMVFLVARNAVTLLATTFFYTLLFAGIPALFRRSLVGREGGVVHIFCFYVYAAVPPLIVAIVYGFINPPFLRISEIFVLAMAAYLLLVFRSIRAVLPNAEA